MEQNSLGLFYNDRKGMTVEEKMDEIRTKVEKIRKKHADKESDLKYKGRLSGFIIVPDEVVFSGENFTHAEFRLWIILRKHCREVNGVLHFAFPGRKRLAKMMGIKSLYRISELTGSLEKKGVIEGERLYLGRTNHYAVKDPPRRWVNEMKKELKKMPEEEDLDFPGKKYCKQYHENIENEAE